MNKRKHGKQRFASDMSYNSQSTEVKQIIIGVQMIGFIFNGIIIMIIGYSLRS